MIHSPVSRSAEWSGVLTPAWAIFFLSSLVTSAQPRTGRLSPTDEVIHRMKNKWRVAVAGEGGWEEEMSISSLDRSFPPIAAAIVCRARARR